MPTPITTVHRKRNELRERLNRAHVHALYSMHAGDIGGPDDQPDVGPGLALDFGSVASTWGKVIWHDRDDASIA